MGPPDVDVGDDILSEEAGEDSPANVMTAFTAASAGWDEKSIFYQNELCQKKKKTCVARLLYETVFCVSAAYFSYNFAYVTFQYWRFIHN